ncbi:MAG TPA: N-formylglutamate amidohydrolase [Candidatus Cloacimonadota bacterium]|nr:N-formylglutamate amidohydrolase [Candidatus Cloacimonadota bacterium]
MIRSSYCFGDLNRPLLALAIHNGHEIREDLLKLTKVNDADRLREEDPYTGEIAELFTNHIVVHTSRFEADLNRNPANAIYQSPEDCWDLDVRVSELPPKLLDKIYSDYREWYAVLYHQIHQLIQRSGFLIILDLHSYNHRRGGPDAAPAPQESNPDIILGRSNLPEKYFPRIADLRSRLDAKQVCGRPLDCRCDVKFTGGALSRKLNQDFSENVLTLAIEFKKIWMDEHSSEVNQRMFTELKSVFYKAVKEWQQTWGRT